MVVEDMAMKKTSIAIFMLPVSGRITGSNAWDEQIYCWSAIPTAETLPRMDVIKLC